MGTPVANRLQPELEALVGRIPRSPIETVSNSFSYLHQRGCVTPAQIQNIKNSIDDDLDNLDGYDTVSPEIQVKIKNAIEQGHVADEDWSGVSA